MGVKPILFVNRLALIDRWDSGIPTPTPTFAVKISEQFLRFYMNLQKAQVQPTTTEDYGTNKLFCVLCINISTFINFLC